MLAALTVLLIITTAGCYPPPVNSPTPSSGGDRGGPNESPQASGGGGSSLQSIPTIYPTDNAEASFLKVQGPDIVNGEGEKVALRGINFGYWLSYSGWGLGLTEEPETMLRNYLKSQIDPDKVDTFFNALVDYLMTEEDFYTVRKEGLNFIRLCFHYKYIQETPTKLDEAIQWAKNAGVYVQLCLHAVPGSQANSDYADPINGETPFWYDHDYQEEFIHKWEILAERYKDDPIIAGYELINEPEITDGDLVRDIYKRAIKRIRKIDPNHIIFLDGNHHAEDISIFEPPFADNIVYVLHTYAKSPREIQQFGEENKWFYLMDHYHVPMMCNEFWIDINADKYFDQMGIHWAPWLVPKTTQEWKDWINSINRRHRMQMESEKGGFISSIENSNLSNACKSQLIQDCETKPVGEIRNMVRVWINQFPNEKRQIRDVYFGFKEINDKLWLHALAQTLGEMSKEDIVNLVKHMRDRTGIQYIP